MESLELESGDTDGDIHLMFPFKKIFLSLAAMNVKQEEQSKSLNDLQSQYYFHFSLWASPLLFSFLFLPCMSTSIILLSTVIWFNTFPREQENVLSPQMILSGPLYSLGNASSLSHFFVSSFSLP